MDDLDRKILVELQQDARVPFRQIAEKHGVSIGTVHNRLKKLKQDGILCGYIPILDAQKLGYSMVALIFIQVEGGHIEKVKETILNEFKEVHVIYHISGTYDLVLIARFKDMIDISNFNDRITKTEHMKAEIHLVMNVLKDEYNVKL